MGRTRAALVDLRSGRGHRASGAPGARLMPRAVEASGAALVRSGDDSGCVSSSPHGNGLTEVELTWIEGRHEQWLRFGRVAAERILSRSTRVMAFRPGAVFGFVRDRKSVGLGRSVSVR